ncbi:MAG: hypothetical protein C0392_01770 [Syntrophus sp. (in: bacteria)]|nr:hypothetical protein [Syntrophus sp. (in: bacteria)]
MASYIDLVQATMKYQKTNLERRGFQRASGNTQGISFDALLNQSLEKAKVQSPGLQSLSRGVMSRLDVEDEIKFRECLNFVLKQEGTKHVVDDGGKESSRYGILQSTAKSLGYKGDIKNISKQEVEAIYKKIWDKSGAKDLPLPMSLVHFDTYVNSPAMARRLLKKSDGNLEVYLKSREQRYTRLAEVRPETFNKYLKGWKNRIASLTNAVAEYRKLEKVASAQIYGTQG